MKDYLTKHKTVLISILLVIIFFGWKIYNSQSEISTIENNTELTQEEQKVEVKKEEKDEIIVVYVTGEVKNPGVVRLKDGSRVEDAINEAGGITEDADITRINLAQKLEDGSKIKIPNINEKTEEDEEITEEIIETEIKHSQNTININTAKQNELETLPGIGPTIATKIIEYRNQNR